MVFHWSLSDSKSPQASRTRLSILAVVVWMVSTRPLISKSSNPINNPSMTDLTPYEIFHTSVNLWLFTWVWLIANNLRSSGFFSVFCPILIMLLFVWSRIVHRFPILPAPLETLWGLSQVIQLQIIMLSLFIHRFFGSPARSKYVGFFFFFFFFFSLSLIFTLWSVETAKSTIRNVLYFVYLSLGLVFRPRSICIKKF